jgi:hypothetical protein
MRRWLQLSLYVSLALAGLRVDATAAGTDVPLWLKLTLGYHYSSGSYGETENTEIGYVPLTIRADVDRWRLQTTIPYLSISGPAGTVEGPSGPLETTSGKSDGLGDILARGSYTFWTDKPWAPAVALGGCVKFPTASRHQGLGTGEFDYGVESELWWAYGKVTPFGVVGYRFLGSPPDSHLRDVFLGSIGGLYQFTDVLSAGILLDYRQAASSESGQRVELVPFASWQATPRWSADLYVSAGLASGSPDAGVGLQLGYTFAKLWN